MGPKNKKVSKNGFSFFLDDYVKRQRKNGRNISHKIAAEECGPLWKNLSPEEKHKYGSMAAAYKNTVKNNSAFKCTSFGISLKDVKKYQELEEEKIKFQDNEIKITISNLDSNMLPHHLFYIIHCNYYCKTDSDVYIPGELAICEFNLRDGIRQSYHQLINPGPIPLGFAYEAQKNIKEIHHLPYPPYSEGNSDFHSIFRDILEFLEPGKLPDGQYPPLYCLDNNIRASESILEELRETKEENSFRVYPLHKLLFALKNKCVEGIQTEDSDDDIIGFPVLTNAILELEKDVFCYVPGISCDFHVTSEEKYHNCSLSIVKRNVYVICDHCCEYLNIAIIPGQHSRLNCDLNRAETVASIQQKSLEQARARQTEKSVTKSTENYFFGENNAPEWTKITSASFLDDVDPYDNASRSRSHSYASVCHGRGSGHYDYSENSYDEMFPSLGQSTRGHGRPT